jgi:hypothetical protein
MTTKTTTINIEGRYGIGSANLRLHPVELGYNDQRPQGFTHCAQVTESQIAKLQRVLPNGPKSLNVTRQDRITGKAIEGEVYFNL